MKLRIKNFGPIKDADIEVNRLNVLVGDNNSGKTYLTYILYGLCNKETIERANRQLEREVELKSDRTSYDIPKEKVSITFLDNLSKRKRGKNSVNFEENDFEFDQESFFNRLFKFNKFDISKTFINLEQSCPKQIGVPLSLR